ncbi:endogenous retrovirus group K member 5 Gag polyprotein-like, partial [Cyanistes caeruleus]|uniref:endogenous retrovirus group K member 5 Gag polyprotein-like n=1 Tax=Cyanistes caeruleus TaxID=156563 RepID=UPI000CDB2ED2
VQSPVPPPPPSSNTVPSGAARPDSELALPYTTPPCCSATLTSSTHAQSPLLSPLVPATPPCPPCHRPVPAPQAAGGESKDGRGAPALQLLTPAPPTPPPSSATVPFPQPLLALQPAPSLPPDSATRIPSASAAPAVLPDTMEQQQPPSQLNPYTEVPSPNLTARPLLLSSPSSQLPPLQSTQNSFNNPHLTDWHEVKRQICREESLNPLAMPVLVSQQPGGPKTWAPIPSQDIKELRKAVRDSGICSPYFKQLLKSTLEGYTLTPNDCKNLASVTLTDSQYMLWEFKWRKMLTEVLATYRQSTDADLRALTMSKLTGDHPDDRNEDQINLPRIVLDDIKKMARRAFLQVQPAGTFEKAYNLINQELSEPFTTFVDRVLQAAERQCSDEIARPIMVRDIIENNANAECKRVIKALGKERPTVPEMINACNKIGSPQQMATIQANELGKTLGEKIERALIAQTAQADTRDQKLTEILTAIHLNSQQQSNNMTVMQTAVTTGPCYFCKKPGHIMRYCPAAKGTAEAPNQYPTYDRDKHPNSQWYAKHNNAKNHIPKNPKTNAQCHRVTKQVVASQAPKGKFVHTPATMHFASSPAESQAMTQTCYPQGLGALWQPPNQQPF